MALTEKAAALGDDKRTDFSDLRAVVVTCTLKCPDQTSRLAADGDPRDPPRTGAARGNSRHSFH